MRTPDTEDHVSMVHKVGKGSDQKDTIHWRRGRRKIHRHLLNPESGRRRRHHSDSPSYDISIDDPVEYFQAYCKLRASDASLSDEMRIQLLDELASSRTEHPQSSKRSQPDSDADLDVSWIKASYA